MRIDAEVWHPGCVIAETRHRAVPSLIAETRHRPDCVQFDCRNAALGCVQFDAETWHRALAGFRPMHDILFILFSCIGLAVTTEVQEGTSP